MKKWLLFFAVLLILPTVADAAVSAGESIRITEVMYDPAGTDADLEWLEIYNAGPDLVDLSGWTIEDAGGNKFTMPAFTKLGAGKYFLLYSDNTAFEARFGPGYLASLPVGTVHVNAFFIEMSNSGDVVTLKNDSGEVVDRVAWKNAFFGWTQSVPGGSDNTLVRNEITFVDNSSSWTTTVLPTPGTGLVWPTISTPAVVTPTPTASNSTSSTGERKRYVLVLGKEEEKVVYYCMPYYNNTGVSCEDYLKALRILYAISQDPKVEY